jgi:DNA-binding NtrC family response regulator
MSGPQVLIAEDDEMLRLLIVEMLTDKGLRVMQAADGMQASQILENNAGISLLLSDVKMPRKGGYELVEEALVRNPELKVLMMTAHVEDQPPLAALKAREIRTLPKPLDMDRMCDRVIDMLARP